ncbi:hypothetical protein K7X08_027212 [Anisodus acutangulus]|uniref:Uncharacterized protein n=1 Tax=Anisodus acutangulus TaxID=402998 RepID=A0A9Q1MIH8_9SOLA|nr:hypothetical protein K7X08_027212 [Anisodus acutangulus]
MKEGGKGTSSASDETKGEVNSSGKESSAHYSNGASTSKKITRKTKLTENSAATRIQTAFRAHLVTILLFFFASFLSTNSYNNNIPSQFSLLKIFFSKYELYLDQLHTSIFLPNSCYVEWSSSAETIEELLQKLQQREEAAIKRERAMDMHFLISGEPNRINISDKCIMILARRAGGGVGWSVGSEFEHGRPEFKQTLSLQKSLTPTKFPRYLKLQTWDL